VVNIVGFDLSSRKIAGAVLMGRSPGSSFYFTIETPSKLKDRAVVLNYLREQLFPELEAFVEMAESPFVFVEHPVVGRAGAHATIVQAQVHGVVLEASLSSGAHGVYTVNNKTWKKDVVGNGGASKEQVREWLAANHPRLARMAGDDQDLVDATCVALYGRKIVERGKHL
jgi:Holliday junction resolvasome RuvABC endonuclease subunit